MFTNAIGLLINRGYLVTSHTPQQITLQKDNRVVVLTPTGKSNTCMLHHGDAQVKLNGTSGVNYIKANF